MTDLLNALVLLANFLFIPALSYGSQLALGALGVTLIFGILRFANFAHGDLMAFGTMIAILLSILLFRLTYCSCWRFIFNKFNYIHNYIIFFIYFYCII